MITKPLPQEWEKRITANQLSVQLSILFYILDHQTRDIVVCEFTVLDELGNKCPLLIASG
ncbi:MAG: hypothetical protein JW384_01763 [Nitrosomonadaceae bacterium]|nr:hypothetical protein [Nitrosomonadaceae bacterium]